LLFKLRKLGRQLGELRMQSLGIGGVGHTL
jgi:hypothetical protein